MSNITIPPAALEAGAMAMAKAGYDFAAIEIIDPYTPDAEYWNHTTRAAFLAMLTAWPGMKHDAPSGGGISQEPPTLARLILPLTENPDDKA